MASRKFRLASILRLRQAQEKQAAGELARANALLAAADTHLATAAQHHAAHVITAGDGPAFMASVAARAALNVAVQDAVVERELAVTGSEQAMEQWRQARRTTKSLEHLESKHVQLTREAGFKHEQKTLDDYSTRRPAQAEPQEDQTV